MSVKWHPKATLIIKRWSLPVTHGGATKSRWDIGDNGLLAYPGASPLHWQVIQSLQTTPLQSRSYTSSDLGEGYINVGQQIWPDLIVDVTSHPRWLRTERKGCSEERGLLHNRLVMAQGHSRTFTENKQECLCAPKLVLETLIHLLEHGDLWFQQRN